jgi:hypothetical protein
MWQMEIAERIADRVEFASCPEQNRADGQRLECEEVLQQVLTLERQDRLGVELDAVDGEFAVAQAHDLALGGFGGDFERGREGFAFHEQGMVARGLEGIGEVGEDAGVVVLNGRGFAVHESAGADDVATENMADALMPEAYAEEGRIWAEAFDNLVADSGFVGGARTRRNTDALGFERGNLIECDFVVALDQWIRAQFAEVLDQVVSETVVVIYYK